MYARFDKAEKAANYVAVGLTADYPDAVAEVTLSLGCRHRTETCDTAHIAAVLARFCKTFPMASVEYHPENRYGFVAEIRCHGEKNRRTVFERHQNERPRVVVLLRRIHDQDTLLGSLEVVPKTAGVAASAPS